MTETEHPNMKIGEVCLLTNDVPRLASFYRQLLGVEESSSDETHQFILAQTSRCSASKSSLAIRPARLRENSASIILFLHRKHNFNRKLPVLH